ncbi:uncharacterized protein LOC111701330 [Eurytemora carolleeae]|uniref:uncharacterized protein LOC111701330 n=1 Tax=Eurytemora carolleeae TaxID=1294199 RepID=UPI000C786FBC|nr:uncharacterized protein LOC111701330 [Eurytemora carolleeae]|eukprot:XP_023328341.1 uncharacterized protein LOC111701330 [Eurytemora affinis]
MKIVFLLILLIFNLSSAQIKTSSGEEILEVFYPPFRPQQKPQQIEQNIEDDISAPRSGLSDYVDQLLLRKALMGFKGNQPKYFPFRSLMERAPHMMQKKDYIISQRPDRDGRIRILRSIKQSDRDS